LYSTRDTFAVDSFFNPPFFGSQPYAYQYPKSGNSMAGIFTLNNGFGFNYREYLQNSLKQPLKQNQCYLVYFYANPIFCEWLSTNNLALTFSDSMLTNYKNWMDSNSLVQLPSHILKQGNPIISDTEKWTPIAGVYTAHGGEKYAVIGNFIPDNLTDTFRLCNNLLNAETAYYFVDDVYVLEANAYEGNDTNIIIGDSVYLGIEQIPGVQNNWYSNNQLIKQSQGGIWVKPITTTAYVLESIICGTTYYDTVLVNVSTGMNQLANFKQQLLVYPNPVTNQLTVVSNQSQKFGRVNSIEVTNLLGQQQNVKVEKLTAENFQLNIENLPSGIYFIKATDDKGNLTMVKFVKE
jgi:hypothetical protein